MEEGNEIVCFKGKWKGGKRVDGLEEEIKIGKKDYIGGEIEEGKEMLWKGK